MNGFDRCTHVTGRHTLRILDYEELTPGGPQLKCETCGEKYYIFSEAQVERMKQMDPRFEIIPNRNLN